MPEIKEKHPNWFKMKLERRELLRQLAPETAFNVLFACLEYLETGEKPETLSPIENIVFSAFVPDLDEAWSSYMLRISNGARGGRPKREQSKDSSENHMVSKKPYGTEEETEPEEETEEEIEKEGGAATPPIRAGAREHTHKRTRFVPPTLEEVAAYVKERGSRVDPQGFIDFYASKGWKVGKTPMKDWKAACRNAEHWERWDKAGQPAPHQSGSGNIFADMARKEGIL